MMKTNTLTLSIAALFTLSTLAFAQPGGSITPPGAPGQTMKTLDEMEPRIPLIDGAAGVSIGGLNAITINQSGSYYLTGNHEAAGSHGIIVSADNVSIDLRGHTISTSSGSIFGSGIYITANNITLSNGHIDDANFNNGINCFGIVENITVHSVKVRNTALGGIILPLGSPTAVYNCSVTGTSTISIQAALIEGCNAVSSGIGLQGGIIRNSNGVSAGDNAIDAASVFSSVGVTATGVGIYATKLVTNSQGTSANGNGIEAAAVFNSMGISNGGDINSSGIEADQVNGSTGTSTTGDGINATIVTNSMGTTTTTADNSDGIFADLVTDSYGVSAGDDGIEAVSVASSIGESTGDSASFVSAGIHARESIIGSYGKSVNGYGIFGQSVAAFSTGDVTSDIYGVNANLLIGCRAGQGALTSVTSHLDP